MPRRARISIPGIPWHIIQQGNNRSACFFCRHRTYQRSGTLWEGRFRSCLAQSEDYVLACYRYIELNPVRANMVNHSREYPWSSYKANAEGKKSKLIIPHDQYLRLDHRELERRKAYRGLFKAAHLDQPVDDEIRAATNGNYVLGNTCRICASFVSRQRLTRKPKWRMRIKPLGRTCCRKRRISSSPLRLRVLCRPPLL